MKKNSIFIKTISLVTAITFLFSQSSFAVPLAPEIASANSQIIPPHISKDLGQIEFVSHPQGGERKDFIEIVHLQDAHANEESQIKIKKMLESLARQGFSTLFLEGAQSQLDPALFHFFKEPAKNLAVARKLLKEGEFSGAEYFLLEQKEKGRRNALSRRAYGIEDAEAYRRNLVTFKKVFGDKEESDWFIRQLDARLGKISSQLWPHSLSRFVRSWKKFQSGKLDLMAFLRVLNGFAESELRFDLTDPRLQTDYPSLIRILRLQAAEGKYDAEKLKEEKGTFMTEIGKYSLDPSLLKTLTGLGEESPRRRSLPKNLRGVLEKLEQQTHGWDWTRYPQLALMLGSLILRQELESKKLLQEVDSLSDKLFDHMAWTEQDRQLLLILKDRMLLEKLFRLELSRKEYEAVLVRKEKLQPLELLSRLKGLDTGVMKFRFMKEDLKESYVQKIFFKALTFYEQAEEREEWMSKKIFETLERTGRKKAVLITGGFHTEGLKRMFAEHGAAYFQVSPKLLKENKNNFYLRSILGTQAKEHALKSPLYLIPRQAQMDLGADLAWRDELIEGAYASAARIPSKSSGPRQTELAAASLGEALDQTPGAYYFRVDSIIQSYNKVFLFHTAEKGAYAPHPWEVAPVEVNKGNDPQNEARVKKIQSAVDFLKRRADELEDEKMWSRANELGKTTSIVGLDLRTHLLFSDKDKNLARVYHIGRRRSVLYFPLKFIDSIQEDEKGIEELAVYLDRAQRWIEAYQSITRRTLNTAKIHSRMREIEKNFAYDDMRIPRSGESSFLQAHRAHIDDLIEKDAQIKSHDIRDEIKRLKRETYRRDELIIQKRSDGELVTRFDYFEVAQLYGRLAHLYDNLGQHKKALEAYLAQVDAFRDIQRVDEGLLPVQIQEGIVLTFLRAGAYDQFLKELEILLTGSGFPRELKPEEKGILSSLISNSRNRYETEYLYLLGVQREILPPSQTAKIPKVMDRVRELFTQWRILHKKMKLDRGELREENQNFGVTARKGEDRVWMKVKILDRAKHVFEIAGQRFDKLPADHPYLPIIRQMRGHMKSGSEAGFFGDYTDDNGQVVDTGNPDGILHIVLGSETIRLTEFSESVWIEWNRKTGEFRFSPALEAAYDDPIGELRRQKDREFFLAAVEFAEDLLQKVEGGKDAVPQEGREFKIWKNTSQGRPENKIPGFKLDLVRDAYDLLRSYNISYPDLSVSESLSAKVRATDPEAQVYLLDHTTHPANSYKILGSLFSLITQLREAKEKNVEVKTIFAAAVFNRGYAVSLAYKRLVEMGQIDPSKTKLLILMPKFVSEKKIKRIQENGAEVQLFDTYQQALIQARLVKSGQKEQAIEIDHLGVTTGYATIFVDLYQKLKKLEAEGKIKEGETLGLVLPARAGGLISAVKVLKELIELNQEKWGIKLIAVKTHESRGFFLSLTQDTSVEPDDASDAALQSLPVETPPIPADLANEVLDYVVFIDNRSQGMPAAREVYQELLAGNSQEYLGRRIDLASGSTASAAVAYRNYFAQEGIRQFVPVLTGGNEMDSVWEQILQSKEDIYSFPEQTGSSLGEAARVKAQIPTIREIIRGFPRGNGPDPYLEVETLLTVLYGGNVQYDHYADPSRKVWKKRRFDGLVGLVNMMNDKKKYRLSGRQTSKIQELVREATERLQELGIRAEHFEALKTDPHYQNPFLHTFLGTGRSGQGKESQGRLDQAIRAGGFSAEDEAYLRKFEDIFQPEIRIGIEGTDQVVNAFTIRVQHNRDRGPFKGGIRFIYGWMLQADDVFIKRFDELQEQGFSLQEMRYFLRKWIKEETIPLAYGMTTKAAVAKLPYGGGKGAVLFADIFEEGGKMVIREYSGSQLFKTGLTRKYTRLMMEAGKIGPKKDIPAPDAGSGSLDMDRMADEMLQKLYEQALEDKSIETWEPEIRDGFLAISKSSEESSRNSPYLKVLADYLDRFRKATSPEGKKKQLPKSVKVLSDTIGTFTAKSLELGGSEFRPESTGVGVVHVLKEILKREDKVVTKDRPLEGLTAKIAGMGGVGIPAADELLKEGVRLQLISEGPGGVVYKAEGFTAADLEVLKNLKLKTRNFQLLNSSAEFMIPGARLASAEEFLSIKTNVYIPAAKENLITEDNVDRLQADIVIEGANGAVTNEAYDALLKRKVTVIPDSLANAGGVTVSYFEWVQNLRNEKWPREKVIEALKKKLTRAVAAMDKTRKDYKTDWRTAADLLMIQQVLHARDKNLRAQERRSQAGSLGQDEVSRAAFQVLENMRGREFHDEFYDEKGTSKWKFAERTLEALAGGSEPSSFQSRNLLLLFSLMPQGVLSFDGFSSLERALEKHADLGTASSMGLGTYNLPVPRLIRQIFFLRTPLYHSVLAAGISPKDADKTLRIIAREASLRAMIEINPFRVSFTNWVGTWMDVWKREADRTTDIVDKMRKLNMASHGLTLDLVEKPTYRQVEYELKFLYNEAKEEDYRRSGYEKPQIVPVDIPFVKGPIPGYLLFPGGADPSTPLPLVIFFHGLTSRMDQPVLDDFEKILVGGSKVAVLRVDLPRHGRNVWPINRPEDIDHFIEALLQFVDQQPRIDPQHLSLFGVSFGGYVGLRALSLPEISKRFQSLIAVVPPLHDTFFHPEGFLAFYRNPLEYVLQTTDTQTLYDRIQAFALPFERQMELSKHAERILVIGARKDSIVSPGDMNQYRGLLKDPSSPSGSRLVTYPWGHYPTPQDKKALAEKYFDFLLNPKNKIVGSSLGQEESQAVAVDLATEASVAKQITWSIFRPHPDLARTEALLAAVGYPVLASQASSLARVRESFASLFEADNEFGVSVAKLSDFENVRRLEPLLESQPNKMVLVYYDGKEAQSAVDAVNAHYRRSFEGRLQVVKTEASYENFVRSFLGGEKLASEFRIRAEHFYRRSGAAATALNHNEFLKYVTVVAAEEIFEKLTTPFVTPFHSKELAVPSGTREFAEVFYAIIGSGTFDAELLKEKVGDDLEIHLSKGGRGIASISLNANSLAHYLELLSTIQAALDTLAQAA